MRKIPICLVAFSLALLVWVPHTKAIGPSHWRESLERADTLIQKGRYQQAERLTRKLAQGISDTAGTGSFVQAILGEATALRALAMVGMGEDDHGIWLWHTAHSIYPDLRSLDLAPYGSPGQVLAQNPLVHLEGFVRVPERRSDTEHVFSFSCPDGAPPLKCSNGSPPQVLQRKRIKFPRGTLSLRTTGSVRVRVIISPDGQPHSPIIVGQPPAPSMAYAVLKAIREWDYRPAIHDGEPVSAYYHLTVNFKLRE